MKILFTLLSLSFLIHPSQAETSSSDVVDITTSYAVIPNVTYLFLM